VRRLGAGAETEIWLADDSRAGSRIALKFLTGDAAGNSCRRDLLNREWRIGSRLMHPNIIRAFEYHDDPDGPFFGQQFLGNTDIGVIAGTEPTICLRPVAMVADALRYAHGKGVVHRDIKAANLLLDSRGLPYLVDFGVAAAAGSDDVAGSGSEIAMSPQQRAGGAAQASDDIFALGVLVHELLTGHPPAGSPAGTLADGSPMPAALHALLADMMSADPGHRPDAATVAARLADAGFPPGPAPARYVGGAGADEQVLETVTPVRLRTKPSAAAPAVRGTAGISPKMLYGGLAAVLVLLLVVVFVLPSLVDREPSPAVPADSTAAVPATDGADTSAAEEAPARASPGDTSFSENLGAGGIKAATDEALGDLLSQLERLRYRAIDRWGGQPYLDAVNVYEEGDRAYLDRNYRLAGEKYREAIRMLEPFFDRIDTVFAETLLAAKKAFETPDAAEAVRLFDLAAAITPGNREAEAGLARARNLDSVLSLMEQGKRFEADLDFDAAKLAYEKALEIDALWQPATDALERVVAAIANLSFVQRMTEGFDALYAGDFDSARAAFNAARRLDPDSREPADGLMQVDLEVRLAEIRRLEAEATGLEQAEEWETAVVTYQDILKIDPDLEFAQQGLVNARQRAALHARLQGYIEQPDDLSDDANMQSATQLLLDLTRIDPVGPRLADQKAELSRLLKRAATPLAVELVSDAATEVTLFKVGRLGTFDRREISLRPGNYVAVGVRPGYRDVRVEFRVAPEIDMLPVVVQCEEPI